MLAVVVYLGLGGCVEADGAMTGDAGILFEDDDASTESADDLDILWIGAHPDDELFIAPLLGAECVDGGARCGLLVLTRGESGQCKRPALCGEVSLADVRAAELEASAELFGGALEQWDLGDGTPGGASAVADAWAARAGGAEALVARVRDVLVRWAPSTVYTFDPRHGSTCHPDHRVTAAVTLLAAETLGADAPNVRLVEALPDLSEPARAGFRSAAPDDVDIVRFDATTRLASVEDEAWAYAISVLRLHASQFTDAEVEAFRSATPAQRATYWLSAASAREGDARYEEICAEP